MSHEQTVHKAQLLRDPEVLGDSPADLFVNLDALTKRHVGIFRFSSVEPSRHKNKKKSPQAVFFRCRQVYFWLSEEMEGMISCLSSPV